MKKKFLSICMVIVMILSFTACGSSEKKSSSETEEQVEVEENLFSVELTIPADYIDETTQEELNLQAKDEGYKSATLNEDGSVTYIMTKKQHKKMMDELKEEINSAMSDMVNSEDYPNFTAVKANSDFTSFTIKTTSESLDMNESFSVLGFFMYGAMYNTFNNTPVDNIHVDYLNANTGAIIHSADSSELAE